jgi:hypothetical protein
LPSGFSLPCQCLVKTYQGNSVAEETQEAQPEGRRNGNRGAPKGNANRRSHGYHTLRAAVTQLGSRSIPGNTRLGYALKKWRSELVEDLGGQDNISTQQSALVDLAVKSKLLLDSIDAWLLSQPGLINKRKKALFPVVLQRQQLADGLARYLAQLGLERRHKVKTIGEILSQGHEHANHGNGTSKGRRSLSVWLLLFSPTASNDETESYCFFLCVEGLIEVFDLMIIKPLPLTPSDTSVGGPDFKNGIETWSRN